MEQQVERTAEDCVALEYQHTPDETRQALRARAKVTGADRRMKYMAIVISAVCVGTFAVSLAGGERLAVDLQSLVFAAVMCLVVFVVKPQVLTRQLHRMATRHGACRTRVDDTGVAVTNAGGSTHLNWTAAPRYTETADTFVLLSGDKNASCLIVLPKRGTAEPGGVDALRALLDRHISRI
ncbi:YcxB family protein [Streptomyces beihaiensis]|uniref:YcxB family protein n=1 Tax=Streptomyces beihaiensis TaxID=2984495 RepID=A0ABT3TNK1_9ACTN|nr:YcxB family protein [Streptomyces beihaiensis]MCX3058625.1 YcxB family protein [Streptomyces beihaiensis]